MFCRFHNRRGQPALEYVILIAIIVGALVVMQIYIKRGVQGRFREATDDIGDQYDPAHQDYQSFTKSSSEVRETTDTKGITVQDVKNQETLRWGQEKSGKLSETEWGVPTK